MEFNWRLEDKSVCYKRLQSWWDKHEAFEGNDIPYSSTPNRIFTVSTTVGEDEVDLYSIAIIVTDTDICWVGWITSNPLADARLKVGGLEYLYTIIATVMKSQGFVSMVSHAKINALMKPLENSGFINIESNTNFYIKQL